MWRERFLAEGGSVYEGERPRGTWAHMPFSVAAVLRVPWAARRDVK